MESSKAKKEKSSLNFSYICYNFNNFLEKRDQVVTFLVPVKYYLYQIRKKVSKR